MNEKRPTNYDLAFAVCALASFYLKKVRKHQNRLENKTYARSASQTFSSILAMLCVQGTQHLLDAKNERERKFREEKEEFRGR